MQEHYGKEAAKRAIWASFMGLGFFVVMANIHLAYQPSAFDHSQAAYSTLLAPSPRILLGSLVAFFISQQFDRKLFEVLKTRYPHYSAIVRSTMTLTCSQALDTVLFGSALYGLLEGLGEILFIKLYRQMYCHCRDVNLCSSRKRERMPMQIESPQVSSDTDFRFDVIYRSRRSQARVGRIVTPHGVIIAQFCRRWHQWFAQSLTQSLVKSARFAADVFVIPTI